MKDKRFRHRSVMEQEIGFAEGWLHDAKLCLEMAEDNLRDVRKAIMGEETPTKEMCQLLADSVQLVKKARDRVTFFDGVLVGMLQMKKAMEAHAAEDLPNPFTLYRK